MVRGDGQEWQFSLLPSSVPVYWSLPWWSPSPSGGGTDPDFCFQTCWHCGECSIWKSRPWPINCWNVKTWTEPPKADTHVTFSGVSHYWWFAVGIHIIEKVLSKVAAGWMRWAGSGDRVWELQRTGTVSSSHKNRNNLTYESQEFSEPSCYHRGLTNKLAKMKM